MIPKIIHLCWFSNDAYPKVISKCLATWDKYLKGYEIMLWNFDRFPKGKSKWVDEAFENKKYAFAADYIRAYALYNYGGIYLDSDVEVLKNLKPLLWVQRKETRCSRNFSIIMTIEISSWRTEHSTPDLCRA